MLCRKSYRVKVKSKAIPVTGHEGLLGPGVYSASNRNEYQKLIK
jgi:hypothetical protein